MYILILNLDPTEIVGNSIVTVRLQDYELEFEVHRTELPVAMIYSIWTDRSL